MRIYPLLTRTPETGSLRPITEELLAKIYLTPRRPVLRLSDKLGSCAPWSESFEAAPEETVRTVEAGLLAVTHATPHLDPSYLALPLLPKSHAGSHIAALHDLWCDLGALHGPLNTWRHVRHDRATQALEPQAVAGRDYPFCTPAEETLTCSLSVSSRRLTVNAISLCVAPKSDEPLETACVYSITDHSQQTIETSSGAS